MKSVLRWPSPRPDARRVWVCFSYSGAGTTPFRPWASHLPEDTELDLYCYPGREIRSDEPLVDSWPALLADAIEAVEGIANRPCTLFGHSFGAWVAFEAAVHMERSGGRPPVALVVSAADSPAAWEAHNRKPPAARDTDEQLLDWLLAAGQLPREIAQEPELVEMAIALIRADLTAAAEYRYIPGTVTRAPITVLYGSDDPDVDHAVADGWRPLAAEGAFQDPGTPRRPLLHQRDLVSAPLVPDRPRFICRPDSRIRSP